MATPLSSRQLAKIVGITEREVENHIRIKIAQIPTCSLRAITLANGDLLGG
jgi:hypothetical protein